MTTNQTTNSATLAVQKLDRITVVCLSMSIWSGTKSISQSELEAAGGSALPSAIADVGAKKIFNPEDLAPFGKIRTRAYRYLRAHGVNFCRGAVAIPLDKSESILTGLDLLIDEFNRYKADFLASYDARLQNWINQNPGYEELLRNGALSRNEVANRLSATLNTLQVQNVREKDRVRNAQLAEDLGTRLLDEVSTDAEKYNATIVLRKTIPRRGISTIAKLREKLFSLSFLTNKILPVVNMLDDVLTRLPKTGELEGSDCSDFKVAVMILANRRLLQQFVDGQISYESQRNAFFAASPVPIVSAENAQSLPQQTENDSDPTSGEDSDDIFDFDSLPSVNTAPEKKEVIDDVPPEKEKPEPQRTSFFF